MPTLLIETGYSKKGLSWPLFVLFWEVSKPIRFYGGYYAG